jgi:hypothetical protein
MLSIAVYVAFIRLGLAPLYRELRELFAQLVRRRSLP